MARDSGKKREREEGGEEVPSRPPPPPLGWVSDRLSPPPPLPSRFVQDMIVRGAPALAVAAALALAVEAAARVGEWGDDATAAAAALRERAAYLETRCVCV